NFGCGSSREHAPWALLDFGIECIISTSFADIFFNNSLKNGLLLIKLEKKIIDDLMYLAKNKELFSVDLVNQNINVKDSFFKFEIDQVIKNRLLNGYDDIEITLKNKDLIKVYETNTNKFHNWKYITNEK
ncbi:MAG: 3-isopropylmalate dehydratase small subunit, partial [Rickettsiales bacterium]